jgi:hypothetical protein
MNKPMIGLLPDGEERTSLDEARKAALEHPHDILAARRLVEAISEAITDRDSPTTVDELLEEIRTLRRLFGSDEALAFIHAMMLANAAREAVTTDVFDRNARLLDELSEVNAALEWQEYSITGFDVLIMGAQYLGLLRQKRYDEAVDQLVEMSKQAFGGTQSQRLEWLIAVRHGFWILVEQKEFDRIEGQIELVRDFRRRHPGDDHEAPHALVAMLLASFESAERRGDTALADKRFEEAYLLVKCLDSACAKIAHPHSWRPSSVRGGWQDGARASSSHAECSPEFNVLPREFGIIK